MLARAIVVVVSAAVLHCAVAITDSVGASATMARIHVPLSQDHNAVKLSNGVEMPLIIFGTPSCGTQAGCVAGTADAVAVALPLGFTGIDTAAHYMNQRGVAKGIVRSGLPRDAVFIESKVEACNNSFVRLGHCAADTHRVFLQNLEQLNVSAVDLMLLHAPTSTGGGSIVYPGFSGSPPCDCRSAAACAAMQQQWGAMEQLYRAGKAKAIGVSNYCPACLDCLAKTSTVTPMVNQIRIHAGMDALARPGALPAECWKRGITPQAYSPLGSGSSAVLSAPQLKAIGAVHGVSTAQVALRWLAQHGVPSVTAASASEASYMKEDLNIFNWTLSAAEMAALDHATFANETTVKTMCLM
jgi:2,5-diketo-D-gluconate reductase A